jgi:ADP-heptose:LPS heptosyltransferase
VQPSSLLLIKPGSMGDVIHALPVASVIHRAWPDTKLTWIVDPRWAPLLEGNPAIDRVHFFPREHFRGITGFARSISWYRDLRDLRPDVALDLQCLLRSGVMSRCSGARRVYGLSDAREGAGFFYTDKVPVRRDEHAVNRYLRAIPALGIDPETPWEWTLPAGRPCAAFSPARDFILLHPFSRGVGKSLDNESVRAFVEAFQNKSSLDIVIAGVGNYDANHGPGVINLMGRTSLLELVWLMRAARFVVSVDSGPMHIAAALELPLLSIHTWSNPRLVGPYLNKAWIWQGGEIRRQNLNADPLPPKTYSATDAAETGAFVAQTAGIQT